MDKKAGKTCLPPGRNPPAADAFMEKLQFMNSKFPDSS